jgi:hypothetical protein
VGKAIKGWESIPYINQAPHRRLTNQNMTPVTVSTITTPTPTNSSEITNPNNAPEPRSATVSESESSHVAVPKPHCATSNGYEATFLPEITSENLPNQSAIDENSATEQANIAPTPTNTDITRLT